MSARETVSAPRPFVKWAGGKKQLIATLDENLPKTFGTYFEPFLGGGALLFHMLGMNYTHRCSISDLNSELILTYVTIRDRPDDLVHSLKNHEKGYQKDPKTYYYSVRDKDPQDPIERASRLLFLNRTCFNGLYRVNSSGKFNVPLGRYSNPNIVNESKIRSVSRVLRANSISISCRDFGAVLDDAKEGDFVYFDPPYHPVSKTAKFTSYTANDFTHEDLRRLYDLCQRLDSKGCMVLLSNSNSADVLELFSNGIWKINKIPAKRIINSDSSKRENHFELLIKNY